MNKILPVLSKKQTDRFWGYVNRGCGCWLWKASTNSTGYGHIGINGKIHLAHRISYMLANGRYKSSKCILHKCDNPPCVKPSHLYIGDLKDNMRDAFSRKRLSRVGSRNSQAKLNEKIVVEMRKLKGKKSYSNVGKLFGVSKSCADHVLSGRRWAHVKIAALEEKK